jgi:Leucine-rich repeat (LRR) protein
MTHIDLSVNQFDEDVSGVIGGLIHLKELKLSSNRFTTLPSALVAWKDLNHFDISDNELDGTIPESLALSNQLIYLDLALNELQGTIPVTFGNLTSLETLYIHGNQLEGSVPESVCALRSGALAILSVDCELPTVECDCCTDCDNYNPDIYPIG